jgi:hypothetical protein
MSSDVTDRIMSERPNFEDHANQVLRQVRTSLADLVASVRADPANSQDMARRFSLNKNLTWKISKIICETDLYGTAQHLPGKAGMNIFIKAFAAGGASEETIQAVNVAMAAFEHLVERHSADRETFVLMLGNLSANCQQQQNEAHRKLAFRGNSAIWGVQTKVQMSSHFIAPSNDDDLLDIAILIGLIDFRRLRGNVPWTIAAMRKVLDDGSEVPYDNIEPIDTTPSPAEGVPLMQEFSTGAMTDLRTYTDMKGITKLELDDGPVGNVGSATYVTGWYRRNVVSRFASKNNTRGGHTVTLSTPAELLIHDLFVHRDLEYALTPEITLHNLLPSGPQYSPVDPERGCLPVCEAIYELGGGPPDVMVPEIPNYRQMVNAVFSRLSWQPKDFFGLRFKLRYPPIPSVATMIYDLPEKPE